MRVGWAAALCCLCIALILPSAGARRPIDEGEQPRVVLQSEPCAKSAADRQLVTKKLSWDRILKEHYRYHFQTYVKHFPHVALAFVTPWNSIGYDMARTFRSKFDIISPVWLQLRRGGDGRMEITGLHDIDLQWMASLRAPYAPDTCVNNYPLDVAEEEEEMEVEISDPDSNHNSTSSNCGDGFVPPKIVPRLQLESSFSLNEIDSISSVMADVALSYGFDGYVFECPIHDTLVKPMSVIAQATKKKIKSSKGDASEFLFVAVLHPRIEHYQDSVPCTHLQNLWPHFDKFIIMTYDYSKHTAAHTLAAGPNAPIEFVRDALDAVIHDKKCTSEDRKYAPHILVGIPLYGYRGTEPVIAAQVLQWLADIRPKKLRWDDLAGEHFFGETMTYPTPIFIKKRLDIAVEYGLGVALWEIGQGMAYFYDLF